MKKILPIFLLLSLIIAKNSFAQRAKQYPNIDGKVLFMLQADRVMKTQKDQISPNNAFIYIQPEFSLNFNRNWSLQTEWRLQPNDVLTTRNQTNPERYRTFLSNDRGMNFDETALLVEELKVNFENSDFSFFAGKFDPEFGTAHRREKRIGVFASQFLEDYNLREKIGAGIVAKLENSKITASSFFNDNTGLSRSAISDRGRAPREDGLAGNNSTLSSYAISMEGENFFGFDGWFYNLGYRNLSVSNIDGRETEKGYVFGSEYLYEIGMNTALIPFFEVTKINNFTGEKNRDALYTTLALIGRYSSWSASASFVTRNIDQPNNSLSDISDKQFEISIGYKFNDNLTLDVSRAEIEEDNRSGTIVGANLSYLYKF